MFPLAFFDIFLSLVYNVFNKFDRYSPSQHLQASQFEWNSSTTRVHTCSMSDSVFSNLVFLPFVVYLSDVLCYQFPCHLFPSYELFHANTFGVVHFHLFPSYELFHANTFCVVHFITVSYVLKLTSG